MLRFMGDLLKLIWCTFIGLFRSRGSLEAEILTLRHQLNVLQRKAPKRLVFSNFDRFVFASLYRIAPDVLNALLIVKPETVIRWHRAGFRLLPALRARHLLGRSVYESNARLVNGIYLGCCRGIDGNSFQIGFGPHGSDSSKKIDLVTSLKRIAYDWVAIA